MIQVDGVFKEILEITGKIGAVNQMDVLNNLLEEALRCFDLQIFEKRLSS